MICLICRQSETVDELTFVNFQRSEIYLAVSNVPARVCQGCGEAYVDEEVALQLLQGVKKIYEAGILESIIEYNNLT